MKEKISSILKEVEEKVNNINTMQELNSIKSEYIGKKGPITELTSNMKNLSNDEKREVGSLVHELRISVNKLFDDLKEKIENEELNKKLQNETVDITLPSKKRKTGSKHVMSRTEEKFEDLFTSLGYTVYEGPELESDENCFQKLNISKGHPARDAQDTFYLENEFENFLLRTQTSTAQVRAMEENEEKGPLRIVCPGKVYRREEDATHAHQFMQIEGLVIDENVTMADLKGTLELFLKEFLGDKTIVRFRPSFFPFTEPSVEVDVSCFKCSGKGCSLCKGTGFIEVLGAGMVHPNVLEMCGYDTTKYQGFAFGTGMDRFAMFKYNINDIRTIYGNDLRFIEQFNRKDVD